MQPAEEVYDKGGALVLDLIVCLAMIIIAGMNVSSFCVSETNWFQGIMSGLTLGLLSLDTMNLEIIINAGEPQDQKNAKKYAPFNDARCWSYSGFCLLLSVIIFCCVLCC